MRTTNHDWLSSYKDTGAIRIAVPDGHLEGVLRTMFERMDLPYPVSGNGGSYGVTGEYRFENGKKQKVYISMHRPKGIVEHTRDSYFVLGISGKDWWFSGLPISLNGDSEKSFNDGLRKYGLYLVADLGYRPTSVVVAVHKDSDIRNLNHFIDVYSNGRPLKNIGSELVGLARNFIDTNNIELSGRLIDSDGKTESLLRDGIAEAIVEIGETGNAVEENDGRILYPCLIRKTTPQAVARSDARDVEAVKILLDDMQGRFGEVTQEMMANPNYKHRFQGHPLLSKGDKLYGSDV